VTISGVTVRDLHLDDEKNKKVTHWKKLNRVEILIGTPGCLCGTSFWRGD